MDWIRIGDRAINLARANLIDYRGPCGVVDDDRLTVEWCEATGDELILSGAEARAAWAAIVTACPDRAAEADRDDDGAWAEVYQAMANQLGILPSRPEYDAAREMFLRAMSARRKGPGEGRGQP